LREEVAVSAAHTRDRRTPELERQRILASHNRFWRPTDLTGAPSTIQHLLAALTHQGELRHVRRGLYWRGTKTPLGMSPPPIPELLRELAPGPGVGPAGLAAANALRLSTQIPRATEIAVPHRPPSDGGALRFVSRASRAERAAAELTPTEVALLEVLEAWERVLEVSPDDAWARMTAMLTSGDARPDRLTRAARTEPGAVRARLKALLRASGHSELAERIPAPDRRTAALATRSLPAAA
jgi:hypothetical protein